MLIGRKIGGYNQKIVRPGAATITVTGYAPSVISHGLFLNHFDGTDASTTLVDEIPGNTWTINASAELDTAQAKWGVSSLLIPNGVGESVKVVGYTSPNTGEYTYEGWVKWDADWNTGTGTFIELAAITEDPGVVGEIAIGIRIGANGENSTYIRTIGASSGSAGFSIGAIPANTWYHWAFVRSGGDYYIYWNGSRVHSETAGNTSGHAYFRIRNATDNSVNVWVDDTRAVDQALYTGATYSVPSEAFVPT